MRVETKGQAATPQRYFTCEVCNFEFPDYRKRLNVPQKWCAEHKRQGFNRWRAEKRLAAGAASLGSQQKCQECGAPFTKVHRRQFYCNVCAEVSARRALPAYRRTNNEYQKARNKRRRAEIPAVAISERMTAGIKNSLRDGKNGRSWETLVGFTLADLMAHLEKQFLPGMSWDNRGEWHIDHIRPLCSFEFEAPEDPQFREAWALTNLQPLWAGDNIRKGGRWSPPE